MDNVERELEELRKKINQTDKYAKKSELKEIIIMITLIIVGVIFIFKVASKNMNLMFHSIIIVIAVMVIYIIKSMNDKNYYNNSILNQKSKNDFINLYKTKIIEKSLLNSFEEVEYKYKLD